MDELSSLILELLPFIGVGFAAQLVDGSLGMAFGLISSTLLISLGVPPAAASAGVHIVESFTTAASGTSHIAHRKIDWRLFRRLVLPGVLGGAIGTYALTQVDAELARPIILAYLGALALYIIWRALRRASFAGTPRFVPPLDLAGGFLDAAGGEAGPDRHEQSPRPGHRSAQRRGNRHRGGVLRYGDDFGRVHRNSGMGGVHVGRGGAADRRSDGRAARSTGREAVRQGPCCW